FCMSLLKENALALGIDPDFSLMTDAETRMQSERIARDTIHNLLESGDPAVTALAREFRVSAIVKMLLELLPQGYALEPGDAPFDYDEPDALLAAWRARAEEALIAALRAPEV